MAGTYNKVFLVGRLGRDPEMRHTQAGTPVTNLFLATDESYTDKGGNRQNRTEWHKVVVWNRQAETASNYLSKGRLVLIEGSLQTRKWQDQQGQNRYTTEIKAQRVVFMDSQQGASDNAGPAPESPEDPSNIQSEDNQNMGPAFPSEASAIDEAPF